MNSLGSCSNALVARGAELLSSLPVGGVLKQSFVDYPGMISAVLYTIGCNMRCWYCHNPGLVLPELIQRESREDAAGTARWLVRNRYLLDAVVLTGGEPTLHSVLPELCAWLHELGVKVKLDTNGTSPGMLARLLAAGSVDAVAMDLKAPLELDRYRLVVGEQFPGRMLEDIAESIRLLCRASEAVSVEFRSTLSSTECDNQDIAAIQSLVPFPLKLQEVRHEVTLEKEQEKIIGRRN